MELLKHFPGWALSIVLTAFLVVARGALYALGAVLYLRYEGIL